MRDELFIYDDPRFLSGGADCHLNANYDAPPPKTDGCTILRSPQVAEVSGCDVAAALRHRGQAIHGGKSGYHSRPPYNVFLKSGDYPSAGVELETVAKTCTSDFVRRLQENLRSNWFHAERDGSLDPQHDGDYGFEWITEPLPPRVYRDPRTWIGLQNLLVPWVESFTRSECGLHVHVGLEQFDNPANVTFRGIPDGSSRRKLGKYLSAFVYYSMLNPAFVDRVTLRKTSGYCSTSATNGFCEGFRPGMTSAEVVDMVLQKVMKAYGDGQWSSYASQLADWEARGMLSMDLSPIKGSELSEFTGHSVEVNASHPFTIEFRRGKGTLQGISIHRMVELMTLVVRFAWKMAREPFMVIERDDVYKYIAANTKSAALRGMAEKEIG